MKKLRLFFKGSPKELAFIDKWRQKGYFLTSVNHFIYNFEANAVVENTVLAVEYTDRQTPTTSEENPALIHSMQKKLAFKDFYLVYSYYTGNEEDYLLDDTSKIQIKYLEKLKVRIMALSNILILCMVGCLLLMIGFFLDIAVYWILLFPVAFVLCALAYMKINKRLTAAGKLSGLLESDLHPPVTIVIKNQTVKPDFTDLSYLGKWQFYISKKDGYYFKLVTNFSEEQLKSEISSFLNIDLEDVAVVHSTGLFPIGFFMGPR